MPAAPYVRSLNSYTSWTRVLPALGVRIPTSVLPARVQCPLCGGQRLRILNDVSFGGQWHSCDDCGSCGDLIELAVRTWKLSLPATVAKLLLKDVDLPPDRVTLEALDTYDRRVLQLRQRHLAGWYKAQASLQSSQSSLGVVLGKLGLRSELSGERFRSGPGQLLGGIWRDDAERLFQDYTPQSKSPTVHNWRNNSAGRLLRGPKWGHCVVTPYWDVPGRIRGYLFVGRNADPAAGDFVYREAMCTSETCTNSHAAWGDAGLALHPQAVAAGGAKEWNNSVVAVDDAVLMIRLQQRHFRTTSQPLPLVAWKQHGKLRTTHSWGLTEPRRVVLWARQVTPELVLQAIQRNFDISLTGPDTPGPHAWQSWLVSRPCHLLLKQVLRDARPWAEVVSQFICTAEPPQIEEIFHMLRLWHQPTDPLVEAIDDKARERLRTVLTADTPQRCTAVNRKLVTEQNDGWYETIRRDVSLIVDAVLHIQQVVHQKEQNRTYYRGTIRYKGETIEFCERKEQIEKSPMLWMQRLLLEAGLGLLQFNPRWGQQVVGLALQLRPPQFVQAVDVVGWSAETSHFVFPTFSIDRRGEVQPLLLNLLTPETPAKKLRPPTTFSPIELPLLTADTRGNSVAWALVLPTIVNAIAPTYGRVPTGLVLGGDGIAAAAQHLLDTLGWNSQVYQPAMEQEPLTHRWPTLLVNDSSALSLTRWLSQLKDRRHRVGAVEWRQAATLYVTGGWTLAEFEDAVDVSPAWRDVGRAVIPSYLQDLATRDFQLSQTSDDWYADVHEDVAAWIERLGGEGHGVRTASRRISNNHEQDRADTFGDLLARLHVECVMATVREGHLAPRGKLCTVTRDSGDLFIPKESLTILARRNLLLDAASISQLLVNAGQLLGEDDYDEKPGWLVRHEWWAQRLRRWRANGLKLHEG